MGFLGDIMGGGGGKAAGIQTKEAEKALALQKEIYGDIKGLTKPYYDAGTASLDQLMTYLGLSGSTGAKTREQFAAELTPQYTTTTGGPATKMYVGPDGRVYDSSDPNKFSAAYAANNKGSTGFQNDYNRFTRALLGKADYGLEDLGFKPMSPSTSSVNYDGLNKAIDEAMAKQEADGKPAGFGKLLADYEFEEDPGYLFAKEQGNTAIERRLASQGKIFTPEAMKALSEYNTGMAAQGYDAGFARDQQSKSSIYNMLASTAGMGQVATGQQANAGTNYANAATDLYTGIGNVKAAGKQADNASRGSMFGSLVDAGLGYASGGWAGALAGLFK